MIPAVSVPVMDAPELEQMYRLEDRHWYFRGKRLIAKRFLECLLPAAPQRVLDVGCGTGGMTVMLREFGATVGIDSSPIALARCRQRGVRHVINGAGGLPFRAGAFDVVCGFDVIEHDPDDVAVLREMARVCAPGGLVVVTVPAFMFLWSQHDVALGHHRRYRRRQLEAALHSAGLRVERSSYLLCTVFPLAVLVRGLRGRSVQRPRSDFFVAVPGPLNRLLFALLVLESRVLPRRPFPFGVSLIAAARKARQ